jgi:hypothetical protein
MVPEFAHPTGDIGQEDGGLCGEANNGFAGLNMIKFDY